MYNVHITISHVHGNISFYYIHGNSYNVGMCKTGISNTISSGFYQLKKGILLIAFKPFIISTLILDAL